jgi:hypothetical protein
MTASTLSTRVSGTHATGDEALIPCLVLGILEDASRDREGSFAVPTTAIPALLWLELAQMLKDKDGGSLLFGKLNNASTHLMREVLIGVPHLAPKVYVILFAFGDQSSLGSVAGNTSKQLLLEDRRD